MAAFGLSRRPATPKQSGGGSQRRRRKTEAAFLLREIKPNNVFSSEIFRARCCKSSHCILTSKRKRTYTVFYDDITAALGYDESPLFCEDDGEGLVALSDRHWIRSAREAGVKGSYFFRTSPEKKAFRPAVHIAEAKTVDEARAIHRKLWNQGVNPFLIVVLPGEVRVFTGFAFDPDDSKVGEVTGALPKDEGITRIIEALSSFTADAINRGEIWQRQAGHLGADQRVDTTLLKNLEALGDALQQHPYSLLSGNKPCVDWQICLSLIFAGTQNP